MKHISEYPELVIEKNTKYNGCFLVLFAIVIHCQTAYQADRMLSNPVQAKALPEGLIFKAGIDHIWFQPRNAKVHIDSAIAIIYFDPKDS